MRGISDDDEYSYEDNLNQDGMEMEPSIHSSEKNDRLDHKSQNF
jgi:hypothetical protein